MHELETGLKKANCSTWCNLQNIWIWSIMKKQPILYEEWILSNITSTNSFYAVTKCENPINDGIFLGGLSLKYEGE